MSTSPKNIFLLGASGFIGAHTLQQLANDLPLFPVIALVRDVTQAKSEALKALHPNVQIIEGDLNDTSLIKEWASKCPIVVNVASSDHPASAFGVYTPTTTTVWSLTRWTHSNTARPHAQRYPKPLRSTGLHPHIRHGCYLRQCTRRATPRILAQSVVRSRVPPIEGPTHECTHGFGSRHL